MNKTVRATYIYDGLPDYWSGDGRRWDDDKACVFASIGPETTINDIIDQWMDDDTDFSEKPDWEGVFDEDVRAALVDLFVQPDKLDRLHPIAQDMARELGHKLLVNPDGSIGADLGECDCDWCTDRIGDSPQAIALLEIVEA